MNIVTGFNLLFSEHIDVSLGLLLKKKSFNIVRI